MPFELEIGEMTALFELNERFVAKLVKPRFTVPSQAPYFEPVVEVTPDVQAEPTADVQQLDTTAPPK